MIKNRIERAIARIAKIRGLRGRVVKVAIRLGPYIAIYLENGDIELFDKGDLPPSLRTKIGS